MKVLSAAAVMVLALSISIAEGKPRKRVDANGNPVGGFICGLTQRQHYGITDKRFNLALHWATLPHVSAQPGAVVVQRRSGHALGGGPGGHVSRIESLTDDRCFAIVTDEKGTYRRNICKSLVAYVMPGGFFSADNSGMRP